jgi:uncharacterized protein (TIGR02996 family)
MSTDAALLAAIAAHPADDTPRLVYADFLDERGSESDAARAEFIRAQVELARPAVRGDGERRKALAARVKELHKAHAEGWAEPVFELARVPKYWRQTAPDGWDRGFLDSVRFESVAAFRKKVGRVSALTPLVGLSFAKFNGPDVIALARMPQLVSVRVLSLFGRGWGDDEQAVGDEAARALAESPHLARLEDLDLTQNSLTTKGVRALAFSPRLAALKKLWLYGNKIGDATYRMLVTSPLAARMSEWEVNGTNRVTSAAARVIAETPSLGHVTSLSFNNTNIGDDGVEALAAAEHLSGVRSLDFRNSSLTHRGVRALTRSPVFANLRELNFVKTWINGFGARFLRESPYLKKIKDIALYDAVPQASERKLRERFGRRVDFGRR